MINEKVIINCGAYYPEKTGFVKGVESHENPVIGRITNILIQDEDGFSDKVQLIHSSDYTGIGVRFAK